MEPFSIHCVTCAAKLKVSNASAVGQKLACPKCGNMVQVDAPEGWTPPETPPESPKKSSESSETDFDDIDLILKQKPHREKATKAPERRTQALPGSSSKKSPVQNSAQPTTPTTPATAPLLPDDNWTNQSAQKRRNLLLIGAGISGVVLIVVAIALAIDANRKPTASATIADNNEIEDIEISEVTANPENSNTVEPSPPSTRPDTDAPDAISSESDELPVQDDQQPVNENDATQNEAPTHSDIETQEPERPDADETPKPQQPPPFRSDLDDILQPLSASVDDVATNFDALAEALENKGSSLFELNQWARINSEQNRIGLPKYYIKKPGPLDSKDIRELDDPILGIQLTNHTFLELLSEITQITGVPISFDTDNDYFDKFNVGFPLVDFTRTDSSYARVIKSALETATDKLGLGLVGTQGATIFAAHPSSTIPATINLPNLQSMAPDQFVELVKQMIAPNSWNLDENKTLDLKDGSIRIQHYPAVVSQLRQLVEKWNLAFAIRHKNAVVNSLQSRWSKSAISRATAIQMSLPDDLPILEFAAKLQQLSNVNLLVDFNSMIEQGWNPNTMIPMNISETSIEKLLDEIVHSMDVTFRVVNPNTFELLTQERLAEIIEVECYYCGDILAGSINRQQLYEIVRQALQAANRLDGSCRVYFENEIDSFIVAGSQDVQRLLESVLDRLRDL